MLCTPAFSVSLITIHNMKPIILPTTIQKRSATFVMVAALGFGMLSVAQPAEAQFPGDGVRSGGSNAATPSGASSRSSLGNMTRDDLMALIRELLQQIIAQTDIPSSAGGVNNQTQLYIQSPAASVPARNEFGVGGGVATNGNVRVRALAGLRGDTVRVLPNDSSGTVIGGPRQADGFTWWQIDYGNAGAGWSAQQTLRLKERASVKNNSANTDGAGTRDRAKTALAQSDGTEFTLDDVASVSSTYYQSMDSPAAGGSTRNRGGATEYTVTLKSGDVHEVLVPRNTKNAAAEFAKAGFGGDHVQLMLKAVRANMDRQETAINNATNAKQPRACAQWSPGDGAAASRCTQYVDNQRAPTLNNGDGGSSFRNRDSSARPSGGNRFRGCGDGSAC